MHVSRYLRAASTLFGIRYRKGRFPYLFRNRIDSNENPDSRLILNIRDNKRNAGDASHQIFPFTSSLIVVSCDRGSQNFLHGGRGGGASSGIVGSSRSTFKLKEFPGRCDTVLNKDLAASPSALIPHSRGTRARVRVHKVPPFAWGKASAPETDAARIKGITYAERTV